MLKTFFDWSCSSNLFHFDPIFTIFSKLFFDQIYFYGKPDNFCCKHFLIGAVVPIYSILFHFDPIFSDFFEKNSTMFTFMASLRTCHALLSWNFCSMQSVGMACPWWCHTLVLQEFKFYYQSSKFDIDFWITLFWDILLLGYTPIFLPLCNEIFAWALNSDQVKFCLPWGRNHEFGVSGTYWNEIQLLLMREHSLLACYEFKPRHFNHFLFSFWIMIVKEHWKSWTK